MLAEEAASRLKLDQVWWVPAFRSPFKEAAHTAARHRLAMLRAALKPYRRHRVLTLELNRPGRSYSVETLTQLRRRGPKGRQFFLLVGSDYNRRLSGWKNSARIRKIARVIRVHRAGFGRRPGEIPMPYLDISSSGIRRRIHRGHPWRPLVPEGVAGYILRHRLYGARPSL